MCRFVLSSLLILLAFHIQAQTVISGKVLDERREPVANVSVSYRKVGSAAMLGFGRTDGHGNFKLMVKANGVDSLQLDFNHMSFAKKSVKIANKTSDQSYTLTAETRQIEEVKVGNIPIFKRKDTINYNVESFTSAQDRVIADIIRKLPGIEMVGEQIHYQGKPIQKYMVNNLDLMEGRYAMINKNLPADAVKNVQIVENDQPIKILDSLVFSDRASLNIELKKFTSTGSGKAGLGAAPFLWDVNLTPMTFGKTFQMLNSFQSNNVGVDVSKDLRAFYTGSGFMHTKSSIDEGPSYIYLRNVPSPGFEERKYLDNKIFLFSTNVLQKLANDLEVKGNVSYYDDTRIRRGFTTTQVFSAEEIIVNSEAVDNRYRIHALDAGALIEKNEKDIYLRNRLQYHKRWNDDLGLVLLNEDIPIEQRRAFTDEALLNAFSVGRFIGKQLVSITSNLEWHRTPQHLHVTPGQFDDLLNAGEPFDRVGQLVDYNGLDWSNSLSFTRRLKRWRLSPTVSLHYNRNSLQTDIEIQDGQQVDILGGDFHNDMLNSQLQLGLDAAAGWESSRWKFNLATPYRLHYFNINQQGVQTLDNTLRSTFNPRASLTYILDSRNEFSANVSGGNQFGGLNNFYNGFIINEYRNINRYDARLLGSRTVNAGAGYNYKNTLKANFAHLRYTYGQGVRDYIYQTRVDSLGRASTVIGDQESQNQNHSLSGGVSRFFSKIKTVVKLNANAGWSASDYMLNEVMARQRIINYGGTLEVINNLSSVVSGEYKTQLGHTVNHLAADRSNTVFYNNHYLTAIVYPKEYHSISLSNSYYHNNIAGQRDQYFMDALYRFTVKRWRLDLELIAQNILNNDNYVQQFASTYELIQSSFELRPRQFLLSTRFRF